jgi:flagellar assembly factor FliW
MIFGSAGTVHLLDQLMTIPSDLLGPVEVEQDELFRFPHGLFGFPDCSSFVLLGAERDGLFWLQSADFSSLTFLLVDPFPLFPGYGVDLTDSDMADLAVQGPDEVSILAIVTLPGSIEEMPTANLQGPLALNMRTRTAKQIVLEEDGFGTRCAFKLEGAAK